MKELLHPFITFLLGIIMAWLFFYFKKKRVAKIILALSFAWLLICSFNFLPNILIRSLENRYATFTPLSNDTTSYHILVLGGGHAEDDRLPPNGQLNITALGRLVEGIRIHRILRSSKLVVSGFSPDSRTPQAEILKKTALLLGVATDDILLQTKPANTYEEASEYTSKFGKNHPLIVVTTGTHMPRAMQMFKMMGAKPIAAPTNFLVRAGDTEDRAWFPSVKNMDKMHTVIKEYLAISVANLRY
jgi:uncharacterized SAM-binding protein YcdF (DUF218 family)